MTMSSAVREQVIGELVRRPYRKVIRGEPVEGYLAEAHGLPGCITAGATKTEALDNLREAMAVWFESALAQGDPVPVPDVWAASNRAR